MKGVIVKFDKIGNFGFIRSSSITADVFFHGSTVLDHSILKAGQNVEFEVVESKKGPRAISVKKGNQHRSPLVRYGFIAIAGVIAMTAAMISMKFDRLNSYFVAISVITILFYGYDKLNSMFEFKSPRIPETVLHGLAIIGGSPAALASQKLFRHKTVKSSFQTVFFIIVVTQIILFVWYHIS